jgi:hypothetical protein
VTRPPVLAETVAKEMQALKNNQCARFVALGMVAALAGSLG